MEDFWKRPAGGRNGRIDFIFVVKIVLKKTKKEKPKFVKNKHFPDLSLPSVSYLRQRFWPKLLGPLTQKPRCVKKN